MRLARYPKASPLMVAAATLLSYLYLVGEDASPALAQSVATSFRVPLLNTTAAIIAAVGIMALNALFVAAETSVECLRVMHVKHSNGRGTRLQRLIDGRPKYVAACNLGSQLARLALVFLGFVLAQGLAMRLEESAGWTYNFGAILLSALMLAVPMVLLNLIFGELVPKSFASLHPHRVALALYRFIKVAAAFFALPASMVVAIANLLTSRFGGKVSLGIDNPAEEEIKSLVDSAEETGAIEEDEKVLLHSVFEFTDTVAREVMTPRVDLDAMPVSSDPVEVVKIIQETGHSRIPLYEGTDDQIVGIVHAKDLLMAMLQGDANLSLRNLMRPAITVTENMDLHDLLAELRAAKSQMAIVQDEFGGTAGIVTTEDIVEELVGDIVDEYDVEEPELMETDWGFLVDGKMHVDDVNAGVGSSFDSEEFDTIGGYVFGLFGRQPKEGDTIVDQGYLFRVAETDGRRILKLAIESDPDADAHSQLEAIGD